jgi:hypothetical protein
MGIPSSSESTKIALMCAFVSRCAWTLVSVSFLIFSMLPAAAQSGPDQRAQEPQKPPSAADAGKDGQKKIDEFAEAARLLGGPAANPECVWLGRRVVNLLWRDDLDTAFRHLDLYDRFGCPGGHIQATFRCVVRQGSIDPKAPESLNARVHACWINPGLSTAQAGAPKAAASGSPTPGTNQPQ